MLTLKDFTIKKYAYRNASGVHPVDFNLEKYNYIVTKPNADLQEVKLAINEVLGLIGNYTSQLTRPANPADTTTQATIQTWINTAQATLQELKGKYDIIANQQISDAEEKANTDNATKKEIAEKVTKELKGKTQSKISFLQIAILGALIYLIVKK